MDNSTVKQIVIHHQVNRQLLKMGRRDDASKTISVRARKIIDNLVKGVPLSSTGRFKFKTDRRLKDSIKFDLGVGFRLICIRKQKYIHVVYLGDHDSCDTWLTHHGRRKPYKNGQYTNITRPCRPLTSPLESISGQDSSNEDMVCSEIPQKYLRQIFKGLVS